MRARARAESVPCRFSGRERHYRRGFWEFRRCCAQWNCACTAIERRNAASRRDWNSPGSLWDASILRVHRPAFVEFDSNKHRCRLPHDLRGRGGVGHRDFIGAAGCAVVVLIGSRLIASRHTSHRNPASPPEIASAAHLPFTGCERFRCGAALSRGHDRQVVRHQPETTATALTHAQLRPGGVRKHYAFTPSECGGEGSADGIG
jgi:hypothetical protein